MKAIFLDRDGVININKPYINSVNDIEFIPDIFRSIKSLSSENFTLFIITNQGGVGLGKITPEEYFLIEDYVHESFKKKGISVEKTYCSFFHPKNPGFFQEHECLRKPRTGMIEKAVKEYGVRVEESYLIGDKVSDIRCGEKAGVKSLLIRNQYTSEDPEYKSDYPYFHSISDVKNYILKT